MKDKTENNVEYLLNSENRGGKIILESRFHSGDPRNVRISFAQIKLLTFICMVDEVKLWSCMMSGKLFNFSVSVFFNL